MYLAHIRNIQFLCIQTIIKLIIVLNPNGAVSSVTFIRFHPKLKARFDYGLLIFILTFCLISVSGYRDDEVLKMAHKRLSTILIGGSAAVVVCSFICPIWAGEDLHNLIAGNIENLGIFLEGKFHATQDFFYYAILDNIVICTK